jgi:predicted nucleic acid-binding protein
VRFTLDSNILVRAVATPRGPALRLLDIILGSHTLVLSRFILDEVERVLLYPRRQSGLFTAADGKTNVLCTRNLRHFSTPIALSFCEQRGIRVFRGGG